MSKVEHAPKKSELRADPELVAALMALVEEKQRRQQAVADVFERCRWAIKIARSKKISHAAIARALDEPTKKQGVRITRTAVREFCVKELGERVRKRRRQKVARAAVPTRPAPARTIPASTTLKPTPSAPATRTPEVAASRGRLNPAFRKNESSERPL